MRRVRRGGRRLWYNKNVRKGIVHVGVLILLFIVILGLAAVLTEIRNGYAIRF